MSKKRTTFRGPHPFSVLLRSWDRTRLACHPRPTAKPTRPDTNQSVILQVSMSPSFFEEPNNASQ